MPAGNTGLDGRGWESAIYVLGSGGRQWIGWIAQRRRRSTCTAERGRGGEERRAVPPGSSPGASRSGDPAHHGSRSRRRRRAGTNPGAHPAAESEGARHPGAGLCIGGIGRELPGAPGGMTDGMRCYEGPPAAARLRLRPQLSSTRPSTRLTEAALAPRSVRQVRRSMRPRRTHCIIHSLPRTVAPTRP